MGTGQSPLSLSSCLFHSDPSIHIKVLEVGEECADDQIAPWIIKCKSECGGTSCAWLGIEDSYPPHRVVDQRHRRASGSSSSQVSRIDIRGLGARLVNGYLMHSCTYYVEGHSAALRDDYLTGDKTIFGMTGLIMARSWWELRLSSCS